MQARKVTVNCVHPGVHPTKVLNDGWGSGVGDAKVRYSGVGDVKVRYSGVGDAKVRHSQMQWYINIQQHVGETLNTKCQSGSDILQGMLGRQPRGLSTLYLSHIHKAQAAACLFAGRSADRYVPAAPNVHGFPACLPVKAMLA